MDLAEVVVRAAAVNLMLPVEPGAMVGVVHDPSAFKVAV
jgi:hypothetical protein